MKTLISKWKLRNGCPPELLEALREATAGVEKCESGTLMYSVHTRTDEALDKQSEIVFIEIYENAAAFEKHLGGTAFLTFKNKYLDYFQTDPAKPTWPKTDTVFLDRQAAFIRTAAGGA